MSNVDAARYTRVRQVVVIHLLPIAGPSVDLLRRKYRIVAGFKIEDPILPNEYKSYNAICDSKFGQKLYRSLETETLLIASCDISRNIVRTMEPFA